MRQAARQYGAVLVAAAGLIAVLTTGAWRWAAFAVFAALLVAVVAIRVTQP